MIVATSKPEVFATKILEHFDLACHFSLICGTPMDAPKGYGKTEVIRNALRRARVVDLTSAVMIGDRHHDIDGAREVGIASIGVLWGYGSRAELSTAGATSLVNNLAELERLLG